MKTNIVLIGMPAAGKSTISAKLSKKMKMVRYDIDKIVEFKENMILNDIYLTKGEDYFRTIETNIIKRISTYNSVIIATGEGSILNDENLKYLKRNSIIFLIDRNINNIYNSNHSNRPTLKDDKTIVFDIYEKRLNLYKKAADYIIINKDDKIDEVVSEIKKIYEKVIYRQKSIKK